MYKNESASLNHFGNQSFPLKGLSFYLLLLLVSFTMEMALPANMLIIVSLLALIYPVVWSICIGLFRQYLQAAYQHVSDSFDRLNNEIGIFITAGFFGQALARSSAGNILAEAILWMSQGLIPLFIVILILSVMLLALAGVHPVIIILGLGNSLTPEQFGVSPAFMGLLILCAWTLSTQISPFSESILMASHLMNERPWIVVKKNISFVLVILMIFTILLSVFEWIQTK
ncbi:hypothetical protein ACE1TI_19610 [Alteribacillus sp. JSM 102045]|uniref:hypothetical protein n=1 Tax=Alteribacillus sp. JSM 102045 TaxID=1562101 RepID=UPI0035C06BFF